MATETVEFSCIITIEIFASKDFKVYGANIDTFIYPDLKLNNYGNITLVGDVHELSMGVPYTVEAEEIYSKKFGVQYKIQNIRRKKPSGKTQTKKFLHEILTENQAEVLLNVYPDIVDKVMNNDLEDIDLSKTKGIKEKTFEKIKTKIIMNFKLVEIVDKYGGYGINFSMLKKLYSNFASVEKLEKALSEDPYNCLCSISGIAFKTADSIIRSIPKETLGIDFDIVTSKQRMKSCIEFILKENESQGNTNMDIIESRKLCKELAPEAIEHFVDLIKNSDEFYLDNKKMLLSRTVTYKAELYVANKLLELLENSKDLQLDYEKFRKYKNVTLTDEQLEALKNLSKYNASLLLGFAGSGKSQTTTNLIQMLKYHGLRYSLMASTGKASDVLSEFTGEKASTIHRGLRYNPSTGWFHNENNKIYTDVIIVDETGMVDIFLMKRLLEAIDTSHTKLMFIQDPAQLPSVSCGNCSYDMIVSNMIPKTELTKIFRYDEGGLDQVATKIRFGDRFVKEDKESNKIVYNFGDKNDYSLITLPQEDMVDAIVKLYKQLYDDGNKFEDIVVLTHHNKGEFGTMDINKKIQKAVNPYENKNFMKVGYNCFIEGDRVMQVVNNYNADSLSGAEVDVFNGNTGIVTDVIGQGTNQEIHVEFKNETIIYNKDTVNQLMLAYCVTIHKYQGSACKNVILLTPDAHIYFMNRNLLYTGVTRTKFKCYHFSSIRLINISLSKSVSMSRNTFLQDMLKENNKYNKS